MTKNQQGRKIFAGGMALTFVACGAAMTLNGGGAHAFTETDTWKYAEEAKTEGGVDKTAGYLVDGVTDVRLTPAIGYENVDGNAPDGYWAWGITSGLNESGSADSIEKISTETPSLASYAMSMYGDAPADDYTTNAAVAAIVHSQMDTGTDLVEADQRRKIWNDALEEAPQEVKDKISEIEAEFERYRVSASQAAVSGMDADGTLQIYVPAGSAAVLTLEGDVVFQENGEKTLTIDHGKEIKVVHEAGTGLDPKSYNISIDPVDESYEAPASDIVTYQQGGTSANGSEYQTMAWAAPEEVELETVNSADHTLDSAEVGPEDPTDPTDPPVDPEPEPEPEEPVDPDPTDPPVEPEPEEPTDPVDPGPEEPTNPPVEPENPAPEEQGEVTSTVEAFDKDDEDEYFTDKGGVITTRYNVDGLVVENKYSVTSKLLDITASKATGENVFLKDADGKDVVITQDFTADTSKMVATVDFAVESGAAGKTFVPVHELADVDGKVLDSVGSTDSTENLMKFAIAAGGIELEDGTSTVYEGEKVGATVVYSNLKPNTEYSISSTLVNSKMAEMGEASTVKFTTDDSGAGEVAVEVALPEGLAAGQYTLYNEIVEEEDGDIIATTLPEDFVFDYVEGSREDAVEEDDKSAEEGDRVDGDEVSTDRDAGGTGGNGTVSDGELSESEKYKYSVDNTQPAGGYNNGASVQTGGEAVDSDGMALTAGIAALIASAALLGGGAIALRKRGKE